MAKKQTYADRAKSIMNKYKPRLGEKFDKGDVLALEAMNQELEGLREEQERARVQKLVDDAGPEQISQLSQVFQAQNNQGPDQPGIPQGGPSGLAGGQAPQATGQPQFARGGNIPNRQQATFENVVANRNVPFVNRMLQGQPVNLEAGVNALGQPSVYPQRFPGSEQPIIPRGGQDLSQVSIGGQNQISFENPRDARRFSRQAPKMLRRINDSNAAATNAAARREIMKPAQFATGGNLPQYQGPGPFSNQLRNRPQYIPGQGIYDQLPFGQPQDNLLQTEGDLGVETPVRGQAPTDWMFESTVTGGTRGQQQEIGTPSQVGQGLFDPNDPYGFNQQTPQLNTPEMPTNFGTGLNFNTGEGYGDLPQSPGTEEGVELGDPFQFRAPWMGAVATGLGSILGNRQLDLGEDRYKAQQVAPNLVDYSREREQFQRDRDISQAMIRRGAAQGGSRAGLMQNLITGATGTQRQLGRQFSTSLQGEANQNAQIRNQAAMFNAQQRAIAGRLNVQAERENQLINAQRRQNQIAGVTGAATGYMRDLMAANRDTGYLRLEEDPDFPIQQRGTTGWKRALGISEDPYKEFVGPGRYMKPVQTRR
jgi:hypothetical protein